MKLFVKIVSLILMVFILAFPLRSFSQQSVLQWTTPIQNVEFADTVIVVTNSGHALRVLNNLKPVHYDISLVKIHVEEIGSPEWNGYQDYEKHLTDFVKDWEISKADKNDKQQFLETCALIILIKAPCNQAVPEEIPIILDNLKRDGLKDIAHNAGLVKALYKSYFN